MTTQAVAMPPADVAPTMQTAATNAVASTSSPATVSTSTAGIPSTVSPTSTTPAPTVVAQSTTPAVSTAPNPTPAAPPATVVSTATASSVLPEHAARKLAVLHRGVVPKHPKPAPTVDHVADLHQQQAPRIEAAATSATESAQPDRSFPSCAAGDRLDLI